MAGLGRKTFTAGEVLTAANVNGFLMDQSVMVFADSAARTTAIPTPTEGMVTYLEDTNALEVFTGASFVPVAEEADLTTLIPKSTVTTAGDLIVADGAGSVTRLGIGLADTVLTSDGTALSFQAAAAGGELYAAGGHTVSKDAGYYLIDTFGTGDFLADATTLSSGINDLDAFTFLFVSEVAATEVWTSRTSGFDAVTVRGVGFGDDLFVAVGSSGTMTTSPDGITWTARTSGFDSTLIFDVRYGTTLWVAVGLDGKLTTSEDGITWTSRTSGFDSTDINSLGFGDDLYVAVGNSGKMTTSADGITWTSRTSGFDSTAIQGVAFGDGLWVAVGLTGKITTSPDAITWTSRTSGLAVNINGVAYDTSVGGLWVVVANSGNLITSPDGITWTARTSGFDIANIIDVAYADGLFVAVGTGGTMTTSPDGITWTARTSGFDTTAIRGVAFGGGVWVAVGSSGKLTTSADGVLDPDAVLLLTELPSPIEP